MAAVLATGAGCSDTDEMGAGGIGGDTGNGGNGGMGGSDVIGPLTWTVSGYTVVDDECDAVTPTEPLEAFELVIAGTGAVLESLDLVVPGTGQPLGGIADPYGPEQDIVVFEAEFKDGPGDESDCVVDAMDVFTVELDDPSVSLDQNETVQVTWDHDEAESPDSAFEGACDLPVWFVQLPCSSQATFTLTQQPSE
ncbi:MAG: hypothetical protein WBN38_14560 [Polyangiales bacterium]